MPTNKVYSTLKCGITQAELKDQFDYDAENGILIRKFRNGYPYNKPCGHKPDCKGYGQVKVNGKIYLVHRLIWLWVYGKFPSMGIDHIDGNRMNNRIENLRDVDSKTNNHNQKILRTNTSGFPRVQWIDAQEKYRVKISLDGRSIHIGVYDKFSDAILASKLAKIQYHPSSQEAKQYADELGIENLW